jgi:hypothetical protein
MSRSDPKFDLRKSPGIAGRIAPWDTRLALASDRQATGITPRASL